MDIKKKLTLEYFRALVAVSMADGILLPEEKLFFESKAIEFGFTVNSVNEMFNSPIEELNTKINHNIDDIDFVTDIVAMALVDGEIHEAEYKLCIELAKRVNLDKEDINNTIKHLNGLIKKT